MTVSLVHGFLGSVARFPDHPALEVGGKSLTYEQLGARAGVLAAAIRAHAASGERLVGVLAHRSATAYSAVLAALAAGRGYVPFNPKFPDERILRTLTLAGTRLLVVGEEAYPQMHALLAALSFPVTVLLPDLAGTGGELRRRYPQHEIVTSSPCPPTSGVNASGRCGPRYPRWKRSRVCCTPSTPSTSASARAVPNRVRRM